MKHEFSRFRTMAAAWIVAIVTSITGCSTATSGNSTPKTSDIDPPETLASKSIPIDVPTIEDPLDTTAFLQSPCATLTQEQLSNLDISGKGEPTTSGGIAEQVGPYCVWFAPEISASASVGFLTNNNINLATAYESRDEFAYFEPTTVDGYPAVFASFDDYRDEGVCNIIVGTSDAKAFRAMEKGELNPQQACNRAKQIAAAALTTMIEG